jgi:hypothetical protein
MQPTKEQVEELLNEAGDFTSRVHFNKAFEYYEQLTGEKLKEREKCSACFQKALNFLWAYVGVVKRFKSATKKVYKERLEICKNCPSLFKPTYTCTECGCFVRVKAYLEAQNCKLNKW